MKHSKALNTDKMIALIKFRITVTKLVKWADICVYLVLASRANHIIGGRDYLRHLPSEVVVQISRNKRQRPVQMLIVGTLFYCLLVFESTILSFRVSNIILCVQKNLY